MSENPRTFTVEVDTSSATAALEFVRNHVQPLTADEPDSADADRPGEEPTT